MPGRNSGRLVGFGQADGVVVYLARPCRSSATLLEERGPTETVREGTRKLTESPREFPKVSTRNSPEGSLQEAGSRWPAGECLLRQFTKMKIEEKITGCVYPLASITIMRRRASGPHEEIKALKGFYPVAKNNRKGSGSSKLCLEAPSGVEPLHRSFADCSLNHLGTAPHEDAIIVASFSFTQHGSKPAARYGASSFKVSGSCPTTHIESSRTHISKGRL
jgi:hypothetical protein